jgi:hypothetical protein
VRRDLYAGETSDLLTSPSPGIFEGQYLSNPHAPGPAVFCFQKPKRVFTYRKLHVLLHEILPLKSTLPRRQLACFAHSCTTAATSPSSVLALLDHVWEECAYTEISEIAPLDCAAGVQLGTDKTIDRHCNKGIVTSPPPEPLAGFKAHPPLGPSIAAQEVTRSPFRPSTRS